MRVIDIIDELGDLIVYVDPELISFLMYKERKLSVQRAKSELKEFKKQKKRELKRQQRELKRQQRS